MKPPEQQPTEHKRGSAQARRLPIAAVGAWACVGVAVIAAALFFLS